MHVDFSIRYNNITCEGVIRHEDSKCCSYGKATLRVSPLAAMETLVPEKLSRIDYGMCWLSFRFLFFNANRPNLKYIYCRGVCQGPTICCIILGRAQRKF